MSHATGIIFSKEASPQILGYYDYDGTADLCLPVIYETREELRKHWRVGEIKYCKCGNPPTPVWIYSDYGSGFHWSGTACFHCRLITSDLSAEVRMEKQDYEDIDGRPDGKPTSYDEIMSEPEKTPS